MYNTLAEDQLEWTIKLIISRPLQWFQLPTNLTCWWSVANSVLKNNGIPVTRWPQTNLYWIRNSRQICTACSSVWIWIAQFRHRRRQLQEIMWFITHWNLLYCTSKILLTHSLGLRIVDTYALVQLSPSRVTNLGLWSVKHRKMLAMKMSLEWSKSPPPHRLNLVVV